VSAAGEGTHALRASIARVGQMLDDYRPNAGLQELSLALPKVEGVVRRLESGRVQPGDRGALSDYVQALAPFAPYLAEELWRRLGEPPFVFQRVLASWER